MALKEGDRIFLRFDSPSRGRRLQAGVVREIREDGWTLAFETRHHAVEVGEEKLVYYNKARDFVQQPVTIEAQSSDGPPFSISVRFIGDAFSAQTRQEGRVSTGGLGLTAAVDDEEGCPVEDVSLSGLAVVSSRKHPIGRCLDVAIRYGDVEYAGQVEVQCSHPLEGGRTRYGLLGVFDTEAGRSLQNSLTRMTLEIQQQHLKRISGSS